MKRSLLSLLSASLSAGLTMTACTDDETPYNQIDKFRVLAIQADEPGLLFGQTATISALVAPPPGVDAVDVDYAWEWCPLSAGQSGDFECLVTQDLLPEGTTLTLGNNSTTILPYAIPPIFFRCICEALSPEPPSDSCQDLIDQGTMAGVVVPTELPPFLNLPACNGKFPISILGSFDNEGTTIRAFKELELIYDDDVFPEPNLNPHLSRWQPLEGTQTSTEGSDEDWTMVAFDPSDPTTPIPIRTDGSTELRRDVTYTLQVGIQLEESEFFERTIFCNPTVDEPTEGVVRSWRENLITTWFYEEGDMRFGRNSLIYEPFDIDRDNPTVCPNSAATDPQNIEKARRDLYEGTQNEWTPPRAINFELDRARLYVVLRDGRGGIDWLAREVRLVE